MDDVSANAQRPEARAVAAPALDAERVEAAPARAAGAPEKADEAWEPFRRSLLRLEQMIEAETQAIHRNELDRLEEAGRAKSLGLLELNRSIAAAQILDRTKLDGVARQQFARLRDALDRNLVALQTRLRAVRQVAAIIARAIEEHESDGTYTANRARKSDAR